MERSLLHRELFQTEAAMREFCEAVGYFELGMYEDALAALQAVPAASAVRPEIRLLHFEILARMGRWESIARLAEELPRSAPKEPRLLELAAEALLRANGGYARAGLLDPVYRTVPEAQGEPEPAGRRSRLQGVREMLRAAVVWARGLGRAGRVSP